MGTLGKPSTRFGTNFAKWQGVGSRYKEARGRVPIYLGDIGPSPNLCKEHGRNFFPLWSTHQRVTLPSAVSAGSRHPLAVSRTVPQRICRILLKSQQNRTGTAVCAASAGLRLLRQTKDQRHPAFVVQTIGMHMPRFNSSPVSANGQGGDVSAAAAVAGILKCLPYELPSIRASIVDLDPIASSVPSTGSTGSVPRLSGPGGSSGIGTTGIWVSAVVDPQAASSTSDLYGLTAHGGAVAVPQMTYSGTGASAGVASTLDITPHGDARLGQHIVTGRHSSLAEFPRQRRRGLCGITPSGGARRHRRGTGIAVCASDISSPPGSCAWFAAN